jgi:hypothetical protein
MRIPVFIPFVNRRDLLEKAVRSAQFPAVEVNVLDNSNGPSIGIPGARFIYRRPTVPLTAAQTLNWMQQIASADADYGEFYFFMHNDTEAAPGTIQKLYEMAMRKCEHGDKWGVIFTLYDTLAAFNTAAFNEVGEWDTNLPQYFTDNDMYRRMTLAGYELAESCLPVKHEGSQTINSDPMRKRVNNITFPIYTRYYAAKWGGEVGHERFERPWDQ